MADANPFDKEDEIEVKTPKGTRTAKTQGNDKPGASSNLQISETEEEKGKFNIRSLFDSEVGETRSEVIGAIRIKPSVRKKLKALLAEEISKGRKVTEASLASEILEKVL